MPPWPNADGEHGDAVAFRARVLAAVEPALRGLEAVSACYEGGAAATGRLDRFSDIDLVIVAPAATHEAVFAAVEPALHAVAPIEHMWRVDPCPFPHMSQRFYLLAGASPFFAVDCAVLDAAGLPSLLEHERHGEARVYFDRAGVVTPRSIDRAAHDLRLRHRRGQIGQSLPVYTLLARKELARGRPLEAHGFYQALVRALTELIGMRHRPDRFDFGLRYVHSDLPADARAVLARLLFVDGPDALAQRIDEVEQAIRLELGREPGR
jgi:hypothetical protein